MINKDRVLEIRNIVQPYIKYRYQLDIMAENLNCDIYYTDMDHIDPSLDGILYTYDNNKNIIIINAEKSLEKQRFTIAHELGHIILKHPKNSVSLSYSGISISPNISIYEKEANIFAAELLMPYDNIVQDIKNGYTIEEMKRIYVVSSPALEIRIKEVLQYYV